MEKSRWFLRQYKWNFLPEILPIVTRLFVIGSQDVKKQF